MNEFLKHPRPETFVKCDVESKPVFTVGLARITHNGKGLKIVPTVYPTFAFNDQMFDLPTNWVRDLAHRLTELCDVADQLNKEQTNA